jgi:hypothetical protein
LENEPDYGRKGTDKPSKPQTAGKNGSYSSFLNYRMLVFPNTPVGLIVPSRPSGVSWAYFVIRLELHGLGVPKNLLYWASFLTRKLPLALDAITRQSKIPASDLAFDT